MASITRILGVPNNLLLHLLYLNANDRYDVEDQDDELMPIGKENVEQRLHRMEAILSQYIDVGSFTSFQTDVQSAVMKYISCLTQLRVFGYFGETIFLKAAESSTNRRTIVDALIKIFRTGLSHPDCPQYQYLIKHYQYCNHPDHIGSIDELDAARMRWMEAPNHTVDPNDWPVDAMNMKPRELLNVLRKAGRKKAKEPIERYTYLDELQDDNDVRVLRTNHDIVEAAKALHNCAANYISSVEQGVSVLLVQMDDRKKKPIASFNAVEKETSVWVKQVNEKNEPIAIAEATNGNTTGNHSPFLSFMCGAGGDPVAAEVREELDTYVKKYL